MKVLAGPSVVGTDWIRRWFRSVGQWWSGNPVPTDRIEGSDRSDRVRWIDRQTGNPTWDLVADRTRARAEGARRSACNKAAHLPANGSDPIASQKQGDHP